MTLEPKTYSDTIYVEGVKKGDTAIIKSLYLHCRKYFYAHFNSIFFGVEINVDDVFQDSFIRTMENIERGKLSVRDGIIYGKENEPMKCTLLTYFMSIAKNLHRENVRDVKKTPIEEQSSQEPATDDSWINDSIDTMWEAISICLSKMSKGCHDIIERFYVEGKKLDQILEELDGYTSKDALKTRKNKCMNQLRTCACGLYNGLNDL